MANRNRRGGIPRATTAQAIVAGAAVDATHDAPLIEQQAEPAEQETPSAITPAEPVIEQAFESAIEIIAAAPVDAVSEALKIVEQPDQVEQIAPAAVTPVPVVEIGAASQADREPVRWLQMETGLSGPTLCLTRGDRHPFDDTPAADGGPSEAQRLIDAGYGIECDAPIEA